MDLLWSRDLDSSTKGGLSDAQLHTSRAFKMKVIDSQCGPSTHRVDTEVAVAPAGRTSSRTCVASTRLDGRTLRFLLFFRDKPEAGGNAFPME